MFNCRSMHSKPLYGHRRLSELMAYQQSMVGQRGERLLLEVRLSFLVLPRRMQGLAQSRDLLCILAHLEDLSVSVQTLQKSESSPSRSEQFRNFGAKSGQEISQ